MKKKILTTLIAGIFIFSMALPVSAQSAAVLANDANTEQNVPEAFVNMAIAVAENADEEYGQVQKSIVTIVPDGSDKSYTVAFDFTQKAQPQADKDSEEKQSLFPKYVPCPNPQGHEMTGADTIRHDLCTDTICIRSTQRMMCCIHCVYLYFVGTPVKSSHTVGAGDCPY